MKKLQELAQTISGQAQSAEKEGSKEEAAKLYIKLVDILLLLARESGDNTKWSQYTRQAEAYQARVKSLIGSAPPPSLSPGPQPAPSNSNIDGLQRPAGPRPAVRESIQPSEQEQQQVADETDPAASKRIGSLKKLFKPFQKADAMEVNSTGAPVGTSGESITQVGGRSPLSSLQKQQQSQLQPQPVAAQISEEAAAEAALIAEQRFQKVSAENKNLRERLDSALKERDELALLLESRTKELQSKIAAMVAKSEYDALAQAHRLSQQASQVEIERLEARLGSSVPKAQFDQLLAMVSGMVPRDLYIQAEVRAAKLESDLKNALPRNLIDSLATDVSIISALAAIPEPDEAASPPDYQERKRGRAVGVEPAGTTA